MQSIFCGYVTVLFLDTTVTITITYQESSTYCLIKVFQFSSHSVFRSLKFAWVARYVINLTIHALPSLIMIQDWLETQAKLTITLGSGRVSKIIVSDIVVDSHPTLGSRVCAQPLRWLLGPSSMAHGPTFSSPRTLSSWGKPNKINSPKRAGRKRLSWRRKCIPLCI